ncbi:coiled-coil domain-containing protein 110 isoform X2 [Labeo rohita]|uniref:coiled-coil domain-containing protein 110 isoform X2 n=1 Tax=Labeo rohita TaxID=84645 RepID=UPI0021E2E713|nr:coiled-coil domain-containing protein 110 isoform X2 [Labeo rohita]
MATDILKLFKQWGLSCTVGFCCSPFGWWGEMQVSTKGSTQMDPDIKHTRRSMHKCKLDGIQDTQQDCDRPVPDKLCTRQPEAISSEMQSNDKEVLSSRWKKGKELPAKSQHAAVDALENKFMKVRRSLLRSTNENVSRDFDEQAMESLQRILAGADLLKKEEATMSILGSKYDFQMDHTSKALRYFIRSNSTRSIECSSNPSKDILKEISKCRERSRADKSSSGRSKHLDFFEVVKEQLQQKDLENQHLVHLLLVKQRELKDMEEMSKQKEKETQLITEKLKCEEQKNTEITTRFERTSEDLKKELAEARSNNKTTMKQLKALMDKYDRLKTRANAMKEQLNVELNEKKSCQKSFKKLQQMSQELLTKQKLLEEQRDVAGRDLALCKETLQMMDSEHKNIISINQKLQEEVSAVRNESANLRENIRKAQEKNKELVQATRFKESNNEKNLKEFQDVIKKLNDELEECRTEKDKAFRQVEAMKYESKLIHNKQRVEILQLEEHQKASLQQSDALRRECETLMEMVSKLKKDKQVLTDKMEGFHKEKMVLEMASMKEGERLKEAIRLLEREREVLLVEMEDLRKDYLGLSDRIMQKMGHVDAADPPMTITDITTNHQRNAQKLSHIDDGMIPDDGIVWNPLKLY